MASLATILGGLLLGLLTGLLAAWLYSRRAARALAQIEAQIEAEAHAFFVTARLYDAGIIDPRDTRTVLGLALSATHSNVIAGRRGFGVFRM